MNNDIKELIKLCEEIDDHMSKEEWSSLFLDTKEHLDSITKKARDIKEKLKRN